MGGGAGGPRRGGVTQHDLAVSAKLLQAQQQAARQQRRQLGAAAALGHRIEAQRMGLDPQQAALLGAAAAANGHLPGAGALGGLQGVAARGVGGVEGSLKQAGIPMPGELELENQRLQMRVKYLSEQVELYEEWFTNRRKNMPELASLFGEPNIKQGMALKQMGAALGLTGGGAAGGANMQATLQKLQAGLLAAGLPGAQAAEAPAAQAAAQPGLNALLAAAGAGGNAGLPTLAQLAQVAQLDQELVAMQQKASAAKNPLGLLESLAALQNLGPGLGGLDNGQNAAAAAVAQAAAQASSQAASRNSASSNPSHRDSVRKDAVLGTPTVGVVRKSPIEPSSPRRSEGGGASSSRDRGRTIKSEPGNGSSRRSSRRRRSSSPSGRTRDPARGPRTGGRSGGSGSSRRRDGRDSRDRDRPRSGSSSSSYSRSGSSRGVPYAPAHHARQLGGSAATLQQMAAAASGYPGSRYSYAFKDPR